MGLLGTIKGAAHRAADWVTGKDDKKDEKKPEPKKETPAASPQTLTPAQQNMVQNMLQNGVPLTTDPAVVQQQIQQQQKPPPVGSLPDIISAGQQGAPKNGETVTLPSGTTIHNDQVNLPNGLSGSKTTIGIPGIEKPVESAPGLKITSQEQAAMFKTDASYTAEQRNRDWDLVNGKASPRPGLMGPYSVDPVELAAATARLNAHWDQSSLANNGTTYLPKAGYSPVQLVKDLGLATTTGDGLDERSTKIRDAALDRLGDAAYMKINQDTDQLYAQWAPLIANCDPKSSNQIAREQQIQSLVQYGIPGNRKPTYKQAAAYLESEAIAAAARLQQAGIPLNPNAAIGNELGLYSPDPRIPKYTPVEPLTWSDTAAWWDRFTDHPGAYLSDLGSDLKNQLGRDIEIASALGQNATAVLTMPLAAMNLPHVEMSDEHATLGEVAIAVLDIATLATIGGKFALTATERAVAASVTAKALATGASREEAVAAATSAVNSFRSLPAAMQEKIGLDITTGAGKTGAAADGGAGVNHVPTPGPVPTLVEPGTGIAPAVEAPWNRGGSALPNLGHGAADVPALGGGLSPNLIVPVWTMPSVLGDLEVLWQANPALREGLAVAGADLGRGAVSGLDGFIAANPATAPMLSGLRDQAANLTDNLAGGELGKLLEGAGIRVPDLVVTVPDTLAEFQKLWSAVPALEERLLTSGADLGRGAVSGLDNMMAANPELAAVLSGPRDEMAQLVDNLTTGGAGRSAGGLNTGGRGPGAGAGRGGGAGRGAGDTGGGSSGGSGGGGGRGGGSDGPPPSEPGGGGLEGKGGRDWPPPKDQRPEGWPDYYWENTRWDPSKGQPVWKKGAEWPQGSGKMVGGQTAENPFAATDIYFDAKAVRSETREPVLTKLADDNEYIKAYDDMSKRVGAERTSIKDEIGTQYENGDFAKLTGHDRDAAFEQLKLDNPGKIAEIEALQSRVNEFFKTENALRKAGEDLGEAGGLAELAAENGELLSNARGSGRLDIIGALERDGNGKLAVWDAKGGGSPNLGDGALIDHPEMGWVKAREGSPEYLSDRLRLELEKDPSLRDRIRALDQKNGWHLEEDLDRALAGDTSGIEYKAIQTDKDGNIQFWDFDSRLGKGHPDYQGPGGVTPTSGEGVVPPNSDGTTLGEISAPLAPGLSQTLSATIQSLSMLIPPTIALDGFQNRSGRQQSSALALEVSIPAPSEVGQTDLQRVMGYGAALLR